jgi:hypothetical protein
MQNDVTAPAKFRFHYFLEIEHLFWEKSRKIVDT